MERGKDRLMTVRHKIEDGQHVVRIYEPDSCCEFLIARWPVGEMDSIEAIWAGFFEARDWAKEFDANHIAVYSDDSAALERFEAELNMPQEGEE